MGLKWIVTPEQAWPAWAQAKAEAIEVEIVAFAENLTDQITAHMKQSAPWTDRTGDARANLYSVVLHEVRRTVTILLSHGSLIPYGVRLELEHQGRFAVLAPTADRFAPVFFRGAQGIVKRHIGG